MVLLRLLLLLLLASTIADDRLLTILADLQSMVRENSWLGLKDNGHAAEG